MNMLKSDRMKVLIVESKEELGAVWERHLVRHGMEVSRASGQKSATDFLSSHKVDIIILDLVIDEAPDSDNNELNTKNHCE